MNKEDVQYRYKTGQVDADNVEELVSLFNEFKPDVVVNVALPYQDLTIMDACLKAGVHYLDTANYEPEDTAKFEYKWQWAYHDKFKNAHLMAVLGCGFDPGVTNIFTAYGLKHFLMKFIRLIYWTAMQGIMVILLPLISTLR